MGSSEVLLLLARLGVIPKQLVSEQLRWCGLDLPVPEAGGQDLQEVLASLRHLVETDAQGAFRETDIEAVEDFAKGKHPAVLRTPQLEIPVEIASTRDGFVLPWPGDEYDWLLSDGVLVDNAQEYRIVSHRLVWVGQTETVLAVLLVEKADGHR